MRATPEPLPAPARSPRRRRARVLAALVTAALLVIVFWVYRVKEQSMWPALIGERDWVLVDRLAPRLGALDRFDIGVFRHEVAGVEQLFVKRVLGFGGEVIDFRGGDVFIGAGGEDPARLGRPESLVERQMIPVPPDRPPRHAWRTIDFDVAGGVVEADGDAVALVPGPHPVVAALIAGPGSDPSCIRDDRLTADGWAVVRGRHAVPDVRVTTGPVSRNGASFSVEHAIGRGERADVRVVTWDGQGLAVVARTDGVESERARFPNVGIPGGVRVETVDGVFRVLLPEGDGWREQFAEPRETATRDGFSELRFRAEGGAARMGWLEVARDVHYVWGDSSTNPQSRLIPPGHLFLVGDNPDVSRDSRDGEFGAVPESEVVGVVRAVVWPRVRLPR